ncbi:MAG: Asp-tRNA(Asn)/Glu-tRNA(Gln) amidotransferase subunit GatA [Ruminococcus sp.]|jgi:aspartyl-tRNA(Asn)/glutamyl-tRNA(Gln) amidotransferase subunit A|nr:Asp-tRNA(Asn)/Glu-tRNA(Gln) amidotransferase subunit GatA [Ruminococcus sp.]
MNIKEARNLLDTKKISSVELTKEYLKKIKAKDNDIEAYITVTEETALLQAEKADKIIADGGSENSNPLLGLPLAIKDNICTKDILTTCSSKILENFVPPYDATVVEKLGGAVILGKTSLDEFAMGGSTQTSYFKKTKNPLDLERVPGGSSGGSAAAVAADMCVASLGSDTGGSIRQPSAFCGVCGLKPTYGRVSRYGLVAFASSLDQIGPIAKTPYDCAIILGAISGYDRHDGTSSKQPVADYTENIDGDIKGLKIAVPKEFYENADSDVCDRVSAAVDRYKSLGCEIIETSMPSLKYAVAAYYLISSAEAVSNLSRYDGIKYGYRSPKGDNYSDLVVNTRTEGFGTEVKRRILLGNYALSSGYYDAYYGKAMALRQKIREEYKAIFEQADVIITPTTPSVAYKTGENVTDPVKMYQADICTVTVNIAGLPAISVPCGEGAFGMPVGMSIIGKPFAESEILKVANKI